MDLPIDVVTYGPPPKFRWKKPLETLSGRVVVECEGLLPPSIELAVMTLISNTKQLMMENEELRRVTKRGK